MPQSGICVAHLLAAALLVSWFATPPVAAQNGAQPPAAPDGEKKPAGDLVAVELKLPKPAFKGTPKNVPPGTNLEPPRSGPRPPLMAPKGATNVALGKPVTSSDKDPIIGSIKLTTDGDKEAKEGSFVELGPRLQWVQIDLKDTYSIYGIVIWHYHSNARIYHDVVVQAADDSDFIKNVRTVFSNDHDNSSGLGVGPYKEYWETYEGKLIETNELKARYLRFYSNGSTADDQNHYTEIEVYAAPTK
jgi:hypothetical protein